ncbi:MAG: aminotransferase class I/II-fold pyridoxal phosphate-dependent enzyme [Eggerthellaceae bacterium]|nr:aminotransferase class I/II-fold pyridoxal phosphate-dependent enzyme [Eggerthellaceae bacterium]
MFDYSKVIAPAVANMKPSGIRKYFGLAETMPNAISLGIGEPDFVTPQHILQAGIDSLLQGKTQYTANNGMLQLRKEISSYIERTYGPAYDPEDEVVVTVGASEAVDLSLRAFLAPGDEALVVEPSFVCYAPLVHTIGATPIPIATKKEDNFKLAPEDLRAAITPKTKMLIISYPNNPTGAVMKKDELEAIADVLRDTNILVLSDEIYAELSYGFRHTSFAAIDGMQERTILISGFSKAFAMTGWRLGYVCGPKELIKHIAQLHQYAIMSAPTAAQYAAVEALQHGLPDTYRMRDEYDTRRKFLHKSLLDMGFDCFEPEGAFYIFPDVSMFAKDGEHFVEDLLKEQELAVIPGVAFGESGRNHVRISYAYSLETLKIAMGRIEAFVESRR